MQTPTQQQRDQAWEQADPAIRPFYTDPTVGDFLWNLHDRLGLPSKLRDQFNLLAGDLALDLLTGNKFAAALEDLYPELDEDKALMAAGELKDFIKEYKANPPKESAAAQATTSDGGDSAAPTAKPAQATDPETATNPIPERVEREKTIPIREIPAMRTMASDEAAAQSTESSTEKESAAVNSTEQKAGQSTPAAGYANQPAAVRNPEAEEITTPSYSQDELLGRK